MKTNLENITNRIKETLTEKSKEAGKKVPRPVVIGITSAALAIGSMIGADVAEAYGPEFKERQATITQQVDEIGGYVPAFANPVHGRAGTSRDSCASGSLGICLTQTQSIDGHVWAGMEARLRPLPWIKSLMK